MWIGTSIVLVASAILSRVGLIAWPFLNDSGLYAALGRTVATGGVMYRDLFDTKLPGAGLLASAFWLAFGAYWPGYVLTQLAIAMLAAVVLARAASRHVGATAVLPTFLFAVTFLNFNYIVFTGFQLETIQAFFEVLAAAAALEAVQNDDPLSATTAGLAAGCAVMAKPGGLGVAVALLVCLLMGKQRRKWVSIAGLLVGLSVPTLVTIYYTIRSGAMPYLPAALGDIHRYVAGTPVRADACLKLAVVLAVIGFPFCLRASRPCRAMLRSRKTQVLSFALLWFTFDFFSAVLQRRLYPYHFLPVVCPAALLYGMLPKTKPLRIALGLLPVSLLSLTWEGSSLSQIRRGTERTGVADYLLTHTTPADAVFADQAGRLLVQTGLNCGSRLTTFFYLVNDDDAPGEFGGLLLADFEARRPKYLVLDRGWDRAVPAMADCDILRQCPERRANFITEWKNIREYVGTHYRKETVVGGQEVYRRNP